MTATTPRGGLPAPTPPPHACWVAVMGDAVRYWEFFPADEPWGQIPVWGFAELVEPGDTALV